MTTAAMLTAETRALRMLRDGWKPEQVSLDVGLSITRVEQLRRDFPSTADHRCPTPACGEPQAGAGRPRKGWVQLKPAAGVARWFCSWPCVSRHALSNIRARP